MKGIAVHEAILTIGMIVISGTLLATQIPAMANDIKASLSKESVIEKSKELANLLSLVTASPDNFELVYHFPEGKVYEVNVKNGYVNVSTTEEWAVSKTLASSLEFSKKDVRTLKISSIGGIVKVE